MSPTTGARRLARTLAATVTQTANEVGGDSAALVVAIIAAVIGLGALAHSVITSRHERRDRRLELELLAQSIQDERDRHAEQLALERERRLDERRADLVARQGSRSGGDREDTHTIHVVNAGGTTARRIHLYVSTELGGVLTREYLAPDLAPDADVTLAIGIPSEYGRGQRDLRLRARWDDGAGPHDEELLSLAPL